jgi:hypothetical protein
MMPDYPPQENYDLNTAPEGDEADDEESSEDLEEGED